MNEEIKIKRSQEIDEILGKVPSKVTRWGITFLFSFFVLLLIASNFVYYPQTINSQLKIDLTQTPSVAYSLFSPNQIQKIDYNDNVLITLDTSHEHTLKGKVIAIDSVLTDHHYKVFYSIDSLQALQSKHTIKQLTGNATIIVENKSFFNHFIKP